MQSKIVTAGLTFLFSFLALAQQTTEQAPPAMADGMRASGKIYVVVGVILIIFLGLALYLFLLDRKIKKLEEQIR